MKGGCLLEKNEVGAGESNEDPAKTPGRAIMELDSFAYRQPE